jgi:thioesterase domain-containing protein
VQPSGHGAHERAGTQPRLTMRRAPAGATGVALLLHGGTEESHDPVRAWSGPVLRMRPFGRAIRRRDSDIDVAFLRFRVQGWNGASADPVADVAFAIDRISGRHPNLPIVLVGHSMGGRAAIRSAGDARVCGVVALAPWLPSGEPTAQLAGRDLVLIHGTADDRTSPRGSAQFADAARDVARSVDYVAVPGGVHSMLRHSSTWHRRTAEAVATMVGDHTARTVER